MCLRRGASRAGVPSLPPIRYHLRQVLLTEMASDIANDQDQKICEMSRREIFHLAFVRLSQNVQSLLARE